MNIKEPRAADGADVLHRSHLTDLSGTELVPHSPPPTPPPPRQLSEVPQELVNYRSLSSRKEDMVSALSAGTKQMGWIFSGLREKIAQLPQVVMRKAI